MTKFVSRRRLQGNGYNSEYLPCEDGFCSSETKHDRRTIHDQSFCFKEEIAGATVTNPNTVLGSSLDEHVGFTNNIFSCDIQRYVSNDHAYDKLLGICRIYPQ
jgi:hypothetical protein